MTAPPTRVSHLYCTTTADLTLTVSGRYELEESDDGSYFLDRDGSVFGHVLAYLRDGVVAAGYERDVRMLGRLKREFDFCCVDLLEEHELVLAAGGYDGNGVLRSVAAYDRRTDSWTESTPMLEARRDFGMCVIAGEVYICGGISTLYRPMASVERYSPLSNTWSSVAAMPTAIHCHGACAVNGSM